MVIWLKVITFQELDYFLIRVDLLMEQDGILPPMYRNDNLIGRKTWLGYGHSARHDSAGLCFIHSYATLGYADPDVAT